MGIEQKINYQLNKYPFIKKGVKPLIAGIIMYIIILLIDVFLLKVFIESNIINTIIIVIVGIVIYVLAIVCLQETLALQVIRKVLHIKKGTEK